MNYLLNDKGETVIAVGAPGSQARVRVEFPKLLHELRRRRESGTGFDGAKRRIRRAGVRTMLEIESLLIEAGYEAGEAARIARL